MTCRFCKKLDECIWMAKELGINFNPDTVADCCEHFEFYLDPMKSEDFAQLVFNQRYTDTVLRSRFDSGVYLCDLEKCQRFIKNNEHVGNRAFLLQGFEPSKGGEFEK